MPQLLTHRRRCLWTTMTVSNAQRHYCVVCSQCIDNNCVVIKTFKPKMHQQPQQQQPTKQQQHGLFSSSFIYKFFIDSNQLSALESRLRLRLLPPTNFIYTIFSNTTGKCNRNVSNDKQRHFYLESQTTKLTPSSSSNLINAHIQGIPTAQRSASFLSFGVVFCWVWSGFCDPLWGIRNE